MKLEHYTEAHDILLSSLDIVQKIEARSIEASVLRRLAVLHQVRGDIDIALNLCDRALSIATELGLPFAQECHELKERFLNEQ